MKSFLSILYRAAALAAGLNMTLSATQIEAESGKSLTGRASVVVQKSASGGKTVRLVGKTVFRKDAPAPEEPADWQVRLIAEKDGTVSLDASVYGADEGRDSFYWNLNGGPVKGAFCKTHQVGEVIPLGDVPLKKGENVLNFWCRETEMTVDAVRFQPVPVAKMGADGGYRLDLAQAILNPARAERVAGGLRLKSGVAAVSGEPERPGDVEFHLTLPPGRYQLKTRSSIPLSYHRELMKKPRAASPRADVLVDDQCKPQLCIAVAWYDPQDCPATMGKYTFSGKEQKLKFFLPPDVTLKSAVLYPYRPPEIPPAVLSYQPKVAPPKTRPRLLVTQATLPQIRKNLTVGENAPVWKAIQKRATQKLSVDTSARRINSSLNFELTIHAKAFLALIKHDKKLARETIELMDAYMQRVDYGNMQDITRAIGQTIRFAAIVYDWLYEWTTPAERDRLRSNMFRLADDMECSWPPFLQSIVIGHGNEHQMTDDLFSMAVAIYDEDPLPHRIIAYRMLEELEPMHAKEYASGRHNQGMSYGMSRFVCDMMAVLNAKRTWNHALFGDSIRMIPYYWFYMRLPNGEIMREGDDWVASSQQGKYWEETKPFFYCHTYWNDPILKGETLRMGDPSQFGVYFLLFNNPNLKPQFDRSDMPLTYMAKDPYPAMIARTGWDFGPRANDTIVYVTGAGLNAGNHQHPNGGAFQIYYRGMLAADLGSYVFDATPYDMNFNRQSISHSMMLLRDPRDPHDNGGQWYGWNCPNSIAEMESSRCGRTLGAGFGPDAKLPLYSYLKTDLTKAYPKGKAQLHERTFFVLNNGEENAPVTVVVTDRMKADPKLQKIWQINSYTVPKQVGKTFEILSLNKEGKLTLFPVFPEVSAQILSGDASRNVFGKQYDAPKESMPEASGSRLMLTPVNPGEETNFLNVMQITRSDRKPAEPSVTDVPGGKCVASGNWRVLYSIGGQKFTQAELDVPAGTNVLIADLKPGAYEVGDLGGTQVGADGVLFFRTQKGGLCAVRPVEKISRKLDNGKNLAPKVKPTSIGFPKADRH